MNYFYVEIRATEEDGWLRRAGWETLLDAIQRMNEYLYDAETEGRSLIGRVTTPDGTPIQIR